MVAIPGKYQFEHTHRLFGQLNILCIMLSSIAISFHYLTFGVARFPPGRGGDLYCKRVPAVFRYPITGVLEMALNSQIPQFIDLANTAQVVPPSSTPSRTTDGLAGIYSSIIGPLFVEFYEGYDDWMYSKLGNPDNWPDIWRFGRVVRNAISHDGAVSIQRKNEAPATWRGQSYSYRDNGRRIFGPTDDLTAGDIFTLMVEMSEELDAQGCRT